jgi:hypothetical protein
VTRPLWTRALEDRQRSRRALLRARVAKRNMGARARMALVTMLRNAGLDVDLLTIHTWPRSLQGEAYLWAISKLAGERQNLDNGESMALRLVIRGTTRLPRGT